MLIPDRSTNSTSMQALMETLVAHGVDGLLPAMRTLLNEAMKMERVQALNAGPYERIESRQGYANGFKDKTIATRMGEMTVQIPQVRGMQFYPQSLEKGIRSEKALKLAMAEMYVMGVSTRKVTEITQKLCGHEVSSTQVSQASKLLDEDLIKFRSRPLGAYAYVWLDARYEKIRIDGLVRDCAVLIAKGVNLSGQREILGVSVSLSEAEVHWRKFLQSLQERGLHGIELIVSDDHMGLRKARRSVFPSIPWQRCQFHMAQNAQDYAPTQAMRSEIGQTVRDIFNTHSHQEAMDAVAKAVKKYSGIADNFVKWLEENIEEGLAIFQFPRSHQRKLRTTNPLERQNREIKRRTRVVGVFPNEESCLRLITALLMETHEEWITYKRYLITDSPAL